MKRSRRRNPETLWRLAALIVPVIGSAAIAYYFRPKDASGKSVSVPPSRVLAGQTAQIAELAAAGGLPLPPLTFVGWADCETPIFRDIKGDLFGWDGKKVFPVAPTTPTVPTEPPLCTPGGA